MKRFLILMADVVDSRLAKSVELAKNLKTITETINTDFKKEISSPLTVTLGDEFQGLVSSRITGIKIIIRLEELLIEKGLAFKLRYVLASGKIDTPINKKIAHGMMGEGLTKTREALNASKRSEERFLFNTGKKDDIISRYFILYQSIVDDWKSKDYKIINDFLKIDDYKTVADNNKKNWSQMWKRKKTFKIREYNIIRQLILEEDDNN